MAVTNPKISFQQSSDGKQITFTDESTYGTGDINNYTRTVQVWSGKDASGSLLATLTFTGTALTVDYDIVKDSYFSAKLVFTGSPTVISPVINFTTTQFEYNALNKFLNKGCGCGSKSESEKVRYGFIYLKLAEKATLGGNSGLANQNITASAKWLI